MKLRSNKLAASVRVGLTFGVLMSAGAAFAQDSSSQPAASEQSAKKLETVTVTGSRIRSVDIETSQPVVTLTQQDIQKTGLINVGDILQNTTIAGPQTYSKAAVLASNSEEGGQYVNLYNLGENRTLVLVNGKRWATSLNGLTDLSTIPASMIDHIDILKDGASSIYGSDAVAGVVNIILKDHYDGAEVSGSIGQQQGGDGMQQQYSATFGTSTDKASLVFSANYNKTDPIWARSRDFTKYTYGPYHQEDGYSGTGPWGRYSLDGTNYVRNHTGGADGVGVPLDGFHQGVSFPDDYYNASQDMMEALGTKQKSVFTQGTYNFTDNFRFKSTAMYTERDSNTQVAGYPFNTANLVEGINPDVVLSGQSYYNPTGQDVNVAERIIQLPRTTYQEATTFHFDSGFEGDFQVGDNPWNWDAGFSYDKYNIDATGSGNLNLLNMQKALGPSFLNSGGVVQCGTAADPISLSQCTPFNILGGPTNSAASLAYVNAIEKSRMQSTNKDFTANITGGLFEMPLNAGTFSFAAGIEHRDISGFNDPDDLASQGYTTDLVSGRTAGGYTTNEAYLELSIPVLKDLPGVKELSFDVASRYSHYSNFGGTTNNKYSFNYTPFDDLKLRGTFAKGFRAPTIADLYGGGSQTFDYYTDPCDTQYGSTGNPTVAANCRAAGLPANFRQLDTAGKPVTGVNAQGTTPFYSSTGNTALQPEYSTTRTLGLVYSPHYVDGLDFTLDYYDIQINNVITGVTADYTLQQCYQYSVQSFCDQFSRDPVTGQVTGLREGTTNLGSLRTKGYNFVASYRLPQLPIGQFRVSLDTNYIDEYTQQSEAGAQKINYAGQWGTPHWRANATADWQLGNWGATWTVRYYGAFLDECWDATTHCNEPNYTSKNWASGPGANRMGAVVMNDIQGRYALPWNASVAVGVRNMFNKQPPITYSVTNNNASSIDPALDLTRYFYIQYNQKF